jgi:hypothetical protein
VNGSQEITWTLHKENPLIAPPWPSPIIADPSLLLPETSPDGKWHLIAHSILGLHSFTSEDGIHWSRPSFLFANAMRPYLYQEGETYYLFYERYRSFQLPFSWVAWWSEPLAQRFMAMQPPPDRLEVLRTDAELLHRGGSPHHRGCVWGWPHTLSTPWVLWSDGAVLWDDHAFLAGGFFLGLTWAK